MLLGFGALVPLSGAADFCRGDANGDERVDLSDAIDVLLHLFRGDAAPPCLDAADANDSGGVEVGDAVFDLSFLFAGGVAPPAPYPVPGWDPTEDGIDCARYPGGPGASSVAVTIVCDNYPHAPGLATAWGFSCLVEVERERVLVDLGPTRANFVGNMTALGLDAATIPRLVLTHEHDDHLGGLSAFLERNATATVYAPQYFATALPGVGGSIVAAGATLVYAGDPMRICRHCYSSGELPGSPKEQGLHVRTKQGLIIITACAHPGIVALVEEAKRQIADEVYLVLGGFHLFKESDATVRSTIGALQSLGVRRVAPCHCSGDRARTLFHEAYGDDYLDIGAGARVAIGGD